MKTKLIVASVVLAACSVVHAQAPYGVLHFDVNGLQGQFYDAPGGAAGGGSPVATLDPGGGSAAGGAAPFSGSLQFSFNAATSLLGSTTGNNSGSLIGPFFPAGNAGTLAAVGGFLDFDLGFVVGGQIEFSNTIGDILIAPIDPSVSGPLGFIAGAYRVSALLQNANFTDAGGDRFFGIPSGGVDLASFLGFGPSDGLLVIPVLAATGAVVDWEVIVRIPSPAGSALFAGAFALALRRRRR